MSDTRPFCAIPTVQALSFGCFLLAAAALSSAGCSSSEVEQPSAPNPPSDDDWRVVESDVARVSIPRSMTRMENNWSIAYRDSRGERVWVHRVARGGTLEARVDSAVSAITRSGGSEVGRDRVSVGSREGVCVTVARQDTYEWHCFFQGPGVFWSTFCRGPTDSREYCDRVLSTLELREP